MLLSFLQLRKKEISYMQTLAGEVKKREQESEAIFRKKVSPLCLNSFEVYSGRINF